MTSATAWRSEVGRYRRDARGPTTRQLEVAAHLSRGESAKAVAAELHLSEHTVIAHTRHLRHYLLAQNTTHAVCECIRRGLID